MSTIWQRMSRRAEDLRGQRNYRWVVLASTGVAISASLARAEQLPQVELAQQEGKIDITVGGQPTATYVYDDAVITHDLAGRVSRLDNALVVTDEWWWYTMYLAALNCPRFDCPTVFALGADRETRQVLRVMFPERDWYNVVLRGGSLTIVPGNP